MLTAQEVHSRVCALLAEALNVDEKDIKLTATLQRDLGAESIDLHDIQFRLEEAFAITIPDCDWLPQTIVRHNPEFVRDGMVTESGLAELLARLPFADLSQFAQDPSLIKLADLYTVEMIANYIHQRLHDNPEQPIRHSTCSLE